MFKIKVYFPCTYDMWFSELDNFLRGILNSLNVDILINHPQERAHNSIMNFSVSEFKQARLLQEVLRGPVSKLVMGPYTHHVNFMHLP